MKTVRKLLVFPLVCLTIAAGSAFANQQHVIDPSQLSAAMADRVATDDANRAAVHEALARAEVHGVAATVGVDLDRLNAAVDTMAGTDLERAASTARQVNEQLVGGASSVTLSTTTIIIILLAIILIVVIAK